MRQLTVIHCKSFAVCYKSVAVCIVHSAEPKLGWTWSAHQVWLPQPTNRHGWSTALMFSVLVRGGDLSFIFQINERSFWSCVLKAHKYSINVAVTAVMNTVTDFKVFMGLKCILHLLIYVKLAVLNLSQNPTWASICVVFDICTHRKVFER